MSTKKWNVSSPDSVKALAKAFEVCPNVEKLTLATREFPSECPPLKYLKNLELVHCDLNRNFASWICATPNLRNLKLSRCYNDESYQLVQALRRTSIERLLVYPRRSYPVVQPDLVEQLLSACRLKYLFVDVGKKFNAFNAQFYGPRNNPLLYRFVNVVRVAGGSAFAKSYNDNGTVHNVISSYPAWRGWDIIGP